MTPHIPVTVPPEITVNNRRYTCIVFQVGDGWLAQAQFNERPITGSLQPSPGLARLSVWAAIKQHLEAK